jgi:hypothetical protein
VCKLAGSQSCHGIKEIIQRRHFCTLSRHRNAIGSLLECLREGVRAQGLRGFNQHEEGASQKVPSTTIIVRISGVCEK